MTLPDSSDKAGTRESFAEVRFQQALKVLQEAMSSPTFSNLSVVKQVNIEVAFMVLYRIKDR